MYRIRRGKDFKVIWSFFDCDGKPYLLEREFLTMYAVNSFCTFEVTDFTVDGNTVIWLFRGKDQKNLGDYTLELVKNNGEDGMIPIETVDAFTLVQYTRDEARCDCGNVKVEDVTINSSLDIDTIASLSIDTALSATSNNAIANFVVTRELNKKQDTIADLETIRSGAAKGATAVQNVVSSNSNYAGVTREGYEWIIMPKTKKVSEAGDPVDHLSGIADAYDVKQELAKKVDKVSGKQLSAEDFTTALKQKLQSLNNYDDSALTSAINSLQNQINTLVSGNASSAIDTFNEIIAFLNGVKDTQDLAGIIASIEQQIASVNNSLSAELAKKPNKTELATINGQSLTNGGNIVIEGKNYDAELAEQEQKLTELSAEVSELSNDVNALIQKDYNVIEVPNGYLINTPLNNNRIYSGVNIFAMANVLDSANLVRGKRSDDNGTIVSDSAEGYIPTYIPVVKNLWLLANLPDVIDRIYYYDKDKNFIKRGSAVSLVTGRGIQIVEDVHYVRFQIKLQAYDSATNPMVVLHDGSSTPTFSDFIACRYNDKGVVYLNEQNFIWSEGYTPFSYMISKDEESDIQLFAERTPWEPSEVDDGYSSPTTGWGGITKREDWSAENKYGYYDFLAHYYDVYLGKRNDGYEVVKRGLWQDTANTGHEVFEYEFRPKNYQYTIMLSAGMNADETQGIWGLATFIRCLMNKEEAQLATLYYNVRFIVIPILNASGFDEAQLRYLYVNGVNPNFNFNFIDSWARQTSSKKGEYPDSNYETKMLKAWVNSYAGKSILWLDLHTGRWDDNGDNGTNKKILDVRFATEPLYYDDFNNIDKPKILQHYIDKGYVTASDNIGSANNVRNNLDYQKHRYAVDICGIPSAMPEMHLESTGYGADGYTNNGAEGIKAYVLQIRQLVMYAVYKEQNH